MQTAGSKNNITRRNNPGLKKGVMNKRRRAIGTVYALSSGNPE